jgi:membrane-bound serine protease (ClpP class)
VTGELLTLTADEAVHIGFASGFADSVDDILEQLDLANAKIQTFEKNWAESLAAFIVSPALASILTLIGLAGLFIEYKTPGFGLFGAVGLVCLALVFWGHSIAYLAGAEGLLLFVLGMILLGVEIFLLPGFGLSGAVGIGLIVTGLVVTFLDVPVFDPTFVPSIHLARPVIMVGFALVGSIVMLIVVSRYLPELNIISYLGISLATELKAEKGYSSHDTDRQLSYVGRVATVISPLKPSGIALLDGDRLNVVTEGDFIETGQKVRVVAVDGFRIVVQPEQEKR